MRAPLQLSAEEDQLLRTLGQDAAGDSDGARAPRPNVVVPPCACRRTRAELAARPPAALLFDDKRSAQARRPGTLLTRVAFRFVHFLRQPMCCCAALTRSLLRPQTSSTGDLESLSYGHGGGGAGGAFAQEVRLRETGGRKGHGCRNSSGAAAHAVCASPVRSPSASRRSAVGLRFSGAQPLGANAYLRACICLPVLSLAAGVLTSPHRSRSLDDSLLFDTQLRGGAAFTVPEGDESADDGFNVDAPSGAAVGHGLYAPQRPGVPTQRGAAPTRQRTPTTRHAPPPTMQPGGVVRRITPPGAVTTFVAASAAKSANASNAALMPPPPPRGAARSVPPVAPLAAPGVPAAAVASATTQFRCAFCFFVASRTQRLCLLRVGLPLSAADCHAAWHPTGHLRRRRALLRDGVLRAST
jgi:hypothetical protein